MWILCTLFSKVRASIYFLHILHVLLQLYNVLGIYLFLTASNNNTLKKIKRDIDEINK